MGIDHLEPVGDDERYGPSRDDVPDEEPAPISSSPDGSASDREPVPYEQWSKAELYERAQQIGIVGRSSMSKSELITALRS